MNRFRKFIFNGLLITAVSLLMRSVSVSFNVYLSNKIGAVAMGVFTLISTVYGFALTVATSGIGLAATRHIAEAVGEDANKGIPACKSLSVRGIVRKCVTYSLFFSLGSAVILYLFAPYIGTVLLGDERTVSSLKVLAISLPPVALSSVYNGYFTAVRRVYKNAIVQVLGQGIKIFACMGLIALLGSSDVESACLSVVIGGTVSELLSFAVQYIFYILEKSAEKDAEIDKKTSSSIWRRVLHTALPVAFSAYLRSGLVTIEHMLIPWGLERSGSSRDKSLAAYGTVHSMVFPLVLFPSALSGSFAGLLVPEVAESQASGNEARIGRIIHRVFHAVLTFAIGTAGIMMCFSYELANTVYPDAGAGRYILMIAPLIPVMYLDTSVDGILKGLGEQVYCMVVNIVDALLSVILVWILLPNMGITGYILTVYFTETVNATLSIARLLTVAKVKPRMGDWIVKPLLAVVIASAVARFIAAHLTGAIVGAWELTFYIVLTTAIYLILLVIMKGIVIKRKSNRP
ncbi:MAG: polysaccharide biosynthesis protein [Clostridia bacterium]|nr:polysaccharide biosynthesis protein [Clostridia bacterium]